MITDQENIFSDAQALTGGTSYNSTNLVDELAATNLGAGQEKVWWYVHLSASSGASRTIAANLVGADDSAFTTNKITITSLPTQTTPTAPQLYCYAVPKHTPKRSYRVEYTTNASGDAFTVTSGLTEQVPTLQAANLGA